MKINSISKGVIASLTIAGAAMISSCNPNTKAEEDRAAKYLTGEEFYEAKKLSESISPTCSSLSLQTAYWDSLFMSYKSKEAYIKGAQMVRDSIAGKPYQKHHYDNIDAHTQIEPSVASKYNHSGLPYELYDEVENTKKEISKLCTAQEFQKLLENQPPQNGMFSGYGIFRKHFWNRMAIQGIEREAYNRGANDERANAQKQEVKRDASSLE